MHELRSSAIPSADEARRWIGSRVDDIHGRQIGRVEEVLTDETAGLDWLLVRHSPSGDACSLVPLSEACRAPRRVWVRLDRRFVLASPTVRRLAQLREEQFAHLAHHYGVQPRRFEPDRAAISARFAAALAAGR